MFRRLLNLATLLALTLALASVAMWARSHFVTGGWKFKPRPSGTIYAGSGWYRQWAVESSAGYLVWCQQFTEPLTPSRYDQRLLPKLPPPRTEGRIPGVVEWCSLPGFVSVPPGRYIAVSWLAIAALGAALPFARLALRWRRRRRAKVPAFPVLATPKQVIPLG